MSITHPPQPIHKLSIVRIQFTARLRTTKIKRELEQQKLEKKNFIL